MFGGTHDTYIEKEMEEENGKKRYPFSNWTVT
jgi:hypothetical protein